MSLNRETSIKPISAFTVNINGYHLTQSSKRKFTMRSNPKGCVTRCMLFSPKILRTIGKGLMITSSSSLREPFGLLIIRRTPTSMVCGNQRSGRKETPMRNSTTAPIVAKFNILQHIFATIMLAAVFVIPAKAQFYPTSPMKGSTPIALRHGAAAGAYPLSGFDSINPFNGKLDFAFPLLEVGGRGQAKYTMMQTINSLPWHYVPYVNQYGDTQYYADPGNQFPNLTANFEPLEVVVSTVRVGGESGCDSTATQKWWLTRMHVVTPDGSQIELRDVSTDGQVYETDCYNQAGRSRGTVFVSNDGSSMTFISDVAIQDYEVQPPLSGYLLTKDGVRYRIEGSHVRWMRDRNGNALNFTYDNYVLKTVTDSLGRKVEIQYPTETNDYTQISFSGFGGASRSIKIWYSDLASSLRSGEQQMSFRQLEIADSDELWNTTVISAIELPDGRSYRFKYNAHADLARVELPTGGAYEYDHEVMYVKGYAPRSGIFDGMFRRVKEKRTYSDGASLESVITFNSTYSANKNSAGLYISDYRVPAYTSVTVDQLDAQRSLVSRTKHYYYGWPFESLFKNSLDYQGWNEGKEYQTEVFGKDGVTVLRRMESTFQQRTGITWWSQWLGESMAIGLRSSYEPSKDPRLKETVTTLVDTNQVTKSSAISPVDGSIGFDQFNNQTDVWEFDYGQGAPGALLRHRHIEYANATNLINGLDYSSPSPTSTSVHIRNLPIRQSIYDGNGVEQARTTFEYDKYNTDLNHPGLFDYSDISNLCTYYESANVCSAIRSTDQATSTVYVTRGNLTGVTSYLLSNGTETGSVSVYSQYDVAGNVVKAIDGRGYATSFEFKDRFGSPDSEAQSNTAPNGLGGLMTYAFPTKVTNALGQIVYSQYDYYLGAVVNSEDPNGVVTAAEYGKGNPGNLDLLDRPSKVIRAVNTSDKSQTSFLYDDAQHLITTTSDLNGYGDNALKEEELYDGLGRMTETRQYEPDGTYIAVKQTYDALGRVEKASNPYRPSAQPPESPVWVTTEYDALGRLQVVTTPDGAKTYTFYNGNQVLVTDQAGKQRLSQSDGIGNLTDVWEIKAADPDTVAVSFPHHDEVLDVAAGYKTHYEYDDLGDLKKVTQGVQTRTFDYDSLKRLKSVTNPESGTTSYNYDENGNLKSKTFARSATVNVTISYDYDALNRLKTRSYSDGTPSVTYTYDTLTSNGKGRLTSASSSVSTTSYTGYDAMGRPTGSSQATNDHTYGFTYEYDLAGNLKKETYPTGRVVESQYDTADRLAGVRNDGATSYYAGASPTDATNRMQYAASGAVTAMKLGNGLWEHAILNNRAQPKEICLGNLSTTSELLRLEYDYGTTDNNGNVHSQTITAGGKAFTQTYTYDSLSRLESAQEPNSVGAWIQTFKYDRFGNRRFDTGQDAQGHDKTTAELAQQNPTISTSTNRVDGCVYDLAGNVTTDLSGNVMAYDAESLMTSFNGSNGLWNYSYDGDGHRVKKAASSGVETTVFVYDALGRLAAEYADARPDTHGTSYLTADTLGSTRIVTDANGTVKGRYDFHPFGEQVSATYGNRTSITGYSSPSDSAKQKFTQYERDGETALDYAQARYFSNMQGRFTSPDPYIIFFEIKAGRNARERSQMLRAYISEPRNWNRYAYCLDDPVNLVDPSGLVWLSNGDGNYQWVDDDKYREEDWPGYKKVDSGTIAYFGEGWGGFEDKYKQFVGTYVILNADGTLSSAGISDADEQFQAGVATMIQWNQFRTAFPDFSPAYAQLEIDAPPVAIQVTNDKYGKLYLGLGGAVGSGANLSVGWLHPNEPALNIERFIEQEGASGAAISPWFLGGGATYSSRQVSPQFMIGTPGVSGSATYTGRWPHAKGITW
jgi:RHS repeat-associated protein